MSLFIKKLKEKGQLEQVQMTIGIVGSRKILPNDDYGSGNWAELAPNLTIYGFDADADACDAANAELESRNISLTVNYGDNPQYNFANTIVDCLSQIPELVKQGLESLPVVATIRHRL